MKMSKEGYTLVFIGTKSKTIEERQFSYMPLLHTVRYDWYA